MASNPPGKCCTVGVKHEGEAVGEVRKIGEVRTYFSYPANKSTENAVLILTDIIGMDFINAQLIADQFAANGYFAVMPDLFDGKPCPLNDPKFDVFGWIKTLTVDIIDPIVDATIKELRNNLGVKRLGAVGYCFGGKYVCRFLKKGVVDVGFTAHPSFVDVPELEGIQGPLSIAAAEVDEIFPTPKRRESEDILIKLGLPYQINLFSGVEHGFSVRADISKPEAKFAKEAAFLQAVHWFDFYLKE